MVVIINFKAARAGTCNTRSICKFLEDENLITLARYRLTLEIQNQIVECITASLQPTIRTISGSLK